MNAKHGKCLLTNLLPKFAIQMVLGDNRYNLNVIHNRIAKCTKSGKEKKCGTDQTQRKKNTHTQGL